MKVWVVVCCDTECPVSWVTAVFSTDKAAYECQARHVKENPDFDYQIDVVTLDQEYE